MEKNQVEKKISAIIPSNNNNKIINTIKSIRSLVDEIIIVNSAKDDCVIPHEYKVKIIQCKKGKTNASKARNIGANEAKNEILFFIDADVEIDPSSIKHFKESSQKMLDTDIYGGLYDFHNKSNIVSNINSLLLRYRVNILNRNNKFQIISGSCTINFYNHKANSSLPPSLFLFSSFLSLYLDYKNSQLNWFCTTL